MKGHEEGFETSSQEAEVRNLENRLASAKEILHTQKFLTDGLPPLKSKDHLGALAPRAPDMRMLGSNGRSGQQSHFRPATADQGAGIGAGFRGSSAPTPRGFAMWNDLEQEPHNSWTELPAKGSPPGPQTSKLLLSRDVKKHRVKWEGLHQCQKLFSLADEIWQVGDEQRRHVEAHASGNTTSDIRLRSLREQLMNMAQEICGPVKAGNVPVQGGSDPQQVKVQAFAEEKKRLRREIKDVEDKADALQSLISWYVGNQDKWKFRAKDIARFAIKSRLETHYTVSVAPVFAAWSKYTILHRQDGLVEEVIHKVMDVMGRTADRVNAQHNEALVESTFAMWSQDFNKSRLEKDRRKREEQMASEKAKKLKAAQKAFGEMDSLVQQSSFLGWQTVAKSSKFNKKRRQEIYNQTLRSLANQGWMMVAQCFKPWSDMVKTARSKRKGKEKLMQQVMQKFQDTEQRQMTQKITAWCRYIQQEVVERTMEAQSKMTMRAKLQKMKTFETMLASFGQVLLVECYKVWVGELEVAKQQKRLKQNGMDGSLRRILGLQAELVATCFREWCDDTKAVKSARRTDNAAEARQNALKQFEKSLGSNQMAVLQQVSRAWREQVELRINRQLKQKALIARAARNMGQTEMMVGMLFPCWVAEAQQSTYLKKSNGRVKKCLDQGRAVITKLRDRQIMKIAVMAWYTRACNFRQYNEGVE